MTSHKLEPDLHMFNVPEGREIEPTLKKRIQERRHVSHDHSLAWHASPLT